MVEGGRNWFDQGGAAYARYRPGYPDSLAAGLAAIVPDRRLALDVGCGNGQFTRDLAAHFDGVLGVDPSADQIAHARPHERVRYAVADAEALPVADSSISLITAAQAAHWFDLPRFYAEVRRLAAPQAMLALISYGVMQLEPELSTRFLDFYRDEIGPYWPPERRMVDTGYADFAFPFAEQPGPVGDIRRDWALADLLGYISTWSATRRAVEAGRAGMLHAFARDMTALWGDAARVRPIAWPIVMRLGRVNP